MTVTPRTRRPFVIGAIAAAALGLAAAAQPVALAAAPQLSVSPSSGLTHGAGVTVSVTGAAAGETYYVAQCANLAGGPACSTVGAGSFVTDANGDAAVSLTVEKSFTGYSPLGEPVGAVDCGVNACYIGAGNAALDLGEVALSFD